MRTKIILNIYFFFFLNITFSQSLTLKEVSVPIKHDLVFEGYCTKNRILYYGSQDSGIIYIHTGSLYSDSFASCKVLTNRGLNFIGSYEKYIIAYSPSDFYQEKILVIDENKIIDSFSFSKYISERGLFSSKIKFTKSTVNSINKEFCFYLTWTNQDSIFIESYSINEKGVKLINASYYVCHDNIVDWDISQEGIVAYLARDNQNNIYISNNRNKDKYTYLDKLVRNRRFKRKIDFSNSLIKLYKDEVFIYLSRKKKRGMLVRIAVKNEVKITLFPYKKNIVLFCQSDSILLVLCNEHSKDPNDKLLKLGDYNFIFKEPTKFKLYELIFN